MAVLTIAGNNRTAYVASQTLSLRLNTLDVILIDPPAVPALGDAISWDAPAWAGTVSEVTVEDHNLTGHKWVKLVGTNTDEAEAAVSPTNFSDAAANYRNLVVTRTRKDGVDEIRGQLDTFVSNVEPGMTFLLTSANQGLSAVEFGATEVAVSWENTNAPIFRIAFGDPIVTLGSWVGDEILPIDTEELEDEAVSSIKIAPLSITDTHITDAAVTTPKLAAGAVVANTIAAGAITAEKLAANIILASLFQTAASGRRVEFDANGIRLYDAGGNLLVKIPTADEPVYISGVLEASDLRVTETASFSGLMELNQGTDLTLRGQIDDPVAGPILTQTLDFLSLASPAPGGYGFGYDAAGGAGGATATYWVGGNPSGSGTDVAYEYDAATGAKLRTITKTGSFETITTTLGATSHVSTSAEATSGTGDSQIATPLTMPRAGRITKVSAYFAGYGGAMTSRVAVWNSSGTLLGNSSTFTAAQTTFANGNSQKHEAALTAPLDVSNGQVIWAGFLRTAGSPGFHWDKDHTGSTKRGDNLAGSMTGISTESSRKPNIFITYEYDQDTSLEGNIGRIIGVARAGSHVWVLDDRGYLFKYLQSDLSYVAQYDRSADITGTEANAGLFYNGTNLIIITTTGTGAGVQLKFLTVSTTTGAVTATVTATGAKTVSGSAATLRGGYYDATYNYVAVVDASGNGVFRWNASTGAYGADNDFGLNTEIGSGVAFHTALFRGLSSDRTRVYTFTDWTWTTASPLYWVAFAWYDSAGTTHETQVGPQSSLTMNRRHKLSITVPPLPGAGGADEPNNVRVYMFPNATAPADSSLKLQVTTTGPTIVLSTYASGGAAPNGGTAFPAGTSARILGTGLEISADGSITHGSSRLRGAGTSFPGSPTSGDLFLRTDLDISFFYDGTRWLSETLYQMGMGQGQGWTETSATQANMYQWPLPILSGGSDIWIEDIQFNFYIVGGTALSGSHSWVCTLNKGTGNNTNTVLATATINSGSSSVWRTTLVAVDALLFNGSSYQVFNMSLTKTGTPGNYRGGALVTYRIVG